MEDLVLSCLESRVEANRNLYARFLVGPFLKGDALTVATALRRVLLSSVESIGIAALYIQGITHEFSTIPGVRESVLELSLNFQAIVLCYDKTFLKKKNVFDDIQIGYLQVQGPKVVYANDLKLPLGIKLVDPTQYIATLSKEGSIVLKFVIGKKNNSLRVLDKREKPLLKSVSALHSPTFLCPCKCKSKSCFAQQKKCFAKAITLRVVPCRARPYLPSRTSDLHSKFARRLSTQRKTPVGAPHVFCPFSVLRKTRSQALPFTTLLCAQQETHRRAPQVPPSAAALFASASASPPANCRFALAKKEALAQKIGRGPLVPLYTAAQKKREQNFYVNRMCRSSCNSAVRLLFCSFILQSKTRAQALLCDSSMRLEEPQRDARQRTCKKSCNAKKYGKGTHLQSQDIKKISYTKNIASTLQERGSIYYPILEQLSKKSITKSKKKDSYKKPFITNFFTQKTWLGNFVQTSKSFLPIDLFLPKSRTSFYKSLCSFLLPRKSLFTRSKKIETKLLIPTVNTFLKQPQSKSLKLCKQKIGLSKNKVFKSDLCLRNIIPLDLTATPVLKVNFVIEIDDELLYLRQPSRERILLEVWTNGSIHPRQAVHDAALSLTDMFASFRSVYQITSTFLPRFKVN